VNSLAALRRRRNWFALLVLPALLFRALIPVGFMPMIGEGGGLSIGICPGVTELPAPDGMSRPGAGYAHHHGADHLRHPSADHLHHHSTDQEGGPGPSTPAHHAPCLFAASAGGAPPPSALGLAAPADTAIVVNTASVNSVLLPTIIRTQTSRGPPALS